MPHIQLFVFFLIFAVASYITADCIMDSFKFLGGLLDYPHSGHVTSTIQALLHCPVLISMLDEFSGHCDVCGGVSGCVTCGLRTIVNSMRNEGVGDPSLLIETWNSISSEFSVDMRRNSFEVLHMFLTKMRAEYLKSDGSLASPLVINVQERIHSTPITDLFGSSLILEVSCPICGVYPAKHYFLTIELQEFLHNDIERSVKQYLQTSEKNICWSCQKVPTTWNPSVEKLAPYLVVHSRKCSSTFKLRMSIKVGSHNYNFLSCFFELKGRHIFIGLGPDGAMRQMEGTKVRNVKLGTLMMSDIFSNSKLTVIYSKVKEPLLQKHEETLASPLQKHPNRRVPHFQITSYPQIDQVDLYSGLPEKSTRTKTTTIGTQTSVPYPEFEESGRGKSASNSDEPLISYAKCKEFKKFQFFTGLNPVDFQILYDLLGGDDVVLHLKLKPCQHSPKKIKDSKVSGEDRLFMFLLRLRRGLPLEELAFVFKLSVSYVSEICYAMTRTLYLTFHSMEPSMFISAADQCKDKPQVMRPFKNLRVILDGASFYIQQPSNFKQQGNTYSSYKSANVGIFTIGVSCTGGTVFCSKGFEGSASDKQVDLESGLLDYLQEGDAVMTDRGYPIRAELQALGVQLYSPPSLGERKILTAEEEILTKAIAAARIYSEHAIADIKDNRLLQGVIPLTLLPVLSNLVYIAAYMRNFKSSRIRDYQVASKTASKNCEGDDDND